MNTDFPLTFAGVRKLATITLDFSEVADRHFQYKTYNGRAMRRISYVVSVHFGHRRGILVFTASVRGVEIGATEVTFDGSGHTEAGQSMGGESEAPLCPMQ